MKYCTFCDEPRDDFLDECPVCGQELEIRGPADDDAATVPAGEPHNEADSSAPDHVPAIPTAAPPEPAEEPFGSLPAEPSGSAAGFELPQAREAGPSDPASSSTGDAGDEVPPDLEDPFDARSDAGTGSPAPEAPAEEASDWPDEGEPLSGEPDEPITLGPSSLDDAFGDHEESSSAGSTSEGPDFETDGEEDVSAGGGDTVDEMERKLLQVIARVNQHLRSGFDLFGLVGHTSSGKTHCLKALSRLLRRHGVDSGKARIQFHEAAAPEQTRRKVYDFAYTGPAGERWVFFDAGGELYLRFHENNWEGVGDEMVALSRWLQKCKGLFMFLHLNEHHFGSAALDEITVFEDEEVLKNERRRARMAQEELAFFKSFLLFLRALRYEEGGLRKLVQTCQEAKSLEDALVEYHRKAPRLDIPIMFFFSQADTFVRKGFEIAPNEQLAPRQMKTSTAAFVAHHLPGLFADVASQVERFKFDFLQSYEELRTGRKDFTGNPEVKAVWEADPETPLSVGLLSGLEFILRNQPRDSWWKGPGISSLRALRWHRRFNPRQWKNVQVSLRHMELSTGGGQ